MVSTSTISTSTNFQKVVHKVLLVGDLISKFILVELTLCTTQLVQISNSTIFPCPKNRTKRGPPVVDILWLSEAFGGASAEVESLTLDQLDGTIYAFFREDGKF